MRSSTAALLLLALLAPLLGSGCAKQLKRIETRVNDVALTQTQIEQDQRELRQILERIDSRETERVQEYAERRAELEAQLLALDRAVRRMDARAEEQDALLRRISAALDMVARQSGARVDTPEVIDPGAGDAMPNVENDEPAPPDRSGGSAGTDVFDAAFADYTRGSYTLARQGFEELLERFPSSELADDAAYWIAETHYADGDYRKALAGFEAIETRYPEGDTLAPTLLKMGYCHLELGQNDQAIASFRRLQGEFPDSDEALIAEHKLTTLGNQR